MPKVRFPGNPPYNKNLIPQDSRVYNHPALNSEHEGYIGMMIHVLQIPGDEWDAEVNFVHPGKCWIGPGAAEFRRWIMDNYDLTSVEATPQSDFPGINVDRFTVSRIRNQPYQGVTRVKHLNGQWVTMNLENNRVPNYKDTKGREDLLVPHFCNQAMYDLWLKMKKGPTLGTWNVYNVGDYGDPTLYSDVQTTDHDVRVARNVNDDGSIVWGWVDLEACRKKLNPKLTGKKFSVAEAGLLAALHIHKGLEVSKHPDVQAAIKHLKGHKVVFKGKPARHYGVIGPKELYDHAMRGISFEQEKSALAMQMWTNDPLYRIQWDSLFAMRDVHTFMRHLSKPVDLDTNPPATREEMYRGWGIEDHIGVVDAAWAELQEFKAQDTDKLEDEEADAQTNSDSRIKDHGEVYTPTRLTNHMLDVYDTADWSNPEIRWIETSVGAGVFMKAIYDRLMVGLETWQPDAEKRRCYIVEEMLFGIDIIPDNITATVKRLGCEDLNHNFHQGDSFKNDFKFKRFVWGTQTRGLFAF